MTRCKVCSDLMKESTGWMTAYTAITTRSEPAFVCTAIDEEILQASMFAHICGERCSLVLFERWLSTGNFDQPQPNRPLTVSQAF